MCVKTTPPRSDSRRPCRRCRLASGRPAGFRCLRIHSGSGRPGLVRRRRGCAPWELKRKRLIRTERRALLVYASPGSRLRSGGRRLWSGRRRLLLRSGRIKLQNGLAAFRWPWILPTILHGGVVPLVVSRTIVLAEVRRFARQRVLRSPVVVTPLCSHPAPPPNRHRGSERSLEDIGCGEKNFRRAPPLWQGCD
jgi:hypothetical protein